MAFACEFLKTRLTRLSKFYSGSDPYNLTAAADYLEALADGRNPRNELLSIGMSFVLSLHYGWKKIAKFQDRSLNDIRAAERLPQLLNQSTCQYTKVFPSGGTGGGTWRSFRPSSTWERLSECTLAVIVSWQSSGLTCHLLLSADFLMKYCVAGRECASFGAGENQTTSVGPIP